MKIYCSGIGGIGLSAYASLQEINGHDVSGSDRASSIVTDDLLDQGIPVAFDQSGAHIPKDADLFVYSEALPEDAPERVRAKELRIRSVSYPQAVGELAKGAMLIAICGTHGKSSTTAMVARLLTEAGLDPTVIVGTRMQELGGRNWRKGASNIFVLEACEYCRSFHHYDPSVILLTTCDGDHFDYYKDQDDYREAFVTFIRKLPSDGVLFAHLSDAECKKVALESGKSVINVDSEELIALNTPGLHMRQNAQLVLALATKLGIDQAKAKKIVSGYAGSWRRLERKGEYKGHTVIDDYAHHPREITASLQGLREWFPKSSLLCVFQPHTHDRTLKLRQEFTSAFSEARIVILLDVYDARASRDTEKVDLKAFAEEIAAASKCPVVLGGSVSEAEKVIARELHADDVIAFLGAGDITKLSGEMAHSS